MVPVLFLTYVFFEHIALRSLCYKMEQEATIQSRIQRAIEESKQAAAEEKQRLLMEASRQMRDALREANVQSDAKEVGCCCCCLSVCRVLRF